MSHTPLILDRRLLLMTAMLGTGALAIPGAHAALSAATGFTHGVASGEPDATSILLWTRFVAGKDTRLTAELSESADFAKIVGGGSVTARVDADHTAKLVVKNLKPGRWYHYRFVAPDGSRSPVGRTRTLPEGAVERFNIAVFSCSNIGFGYFNAYAHAARRGDFDLAMHLGDYFYEYAPGTYPAKGIRPAPEPAHETVTLADYRLRFAAYRADPDLQALHAALPMVAMWDDHESTNDAWKDGAQNHQPDEGDWQVRKAAAVRAYREWMPVRDFTLAGPDARAYRVGDLATIHMTESRLTGRDEQPELAAALAGQADIPAALKSFRDGEWQDPARSMLGAKGEDWLAKSFRNPARWQIWAQQTVMGQPKAPPETASWIDPAAPDYVQQRVQVGLLASKLGLPFNMDDWGGYPAARDRSLKAAQATDANLVVLSGDSHNAWAHDLSADGKPAGVEFAGHGVTSPGFESNFKADPKVMADALVRANPSLKWCDTSRRGYMTVTLTPERASSTWHLLDTITQRSLVMAKETTLSTLHGKRVLEAVA